MLFMAFIESIGRGWCPAFYGNAIIFSSSSSTPTPRLSHDPFLVMQSRKLSNVFAHFTIRAALGTSPASFSVMPKSP